jgi:hypothetical protein
VRTVPINEVAAAAEAGGLFALLVVSNERPQGD